MAYEKKFTKGDTMKIAASLLSANFFRLKDEIDLVEKAGVDSLHIDVMDGHFVPNITLGPCVIESLSQNIRLPMDVHLMIERPELSLAAYNISGVDMIYIHVEATVHAQRALAQVRVLGKKAAIALNPGTNVDAIRHLMLDIDRVLVMTVNPGFSGQAFIPSTLQKIEYLANQITKENLPIEVAVDGGINLTTAPSVINAGANVLIGGSSIFGHPDKNATVSNLRRLGKKQDILQ